MELKGKYFFVILNKQFFKKKAAANKQQTPEKLSSDPEITSNEKKLYTSERFTPATQKTPENKVAMSANLSRTLSPNNNSSVNSANKLKNSTTQSKVNTGTPKKKIRASPIVLETIVNEVVNKHMDNKEKVNSFEEDMNKINECIYLTKLKNEEGEKTQEGLINDSFGDNQNPQNTKEM